jgi:hypothetical protein
MIDKGIIEKLRVFLKFNYVFKGDYDVLEDSAPSSPESSDLSLDLLCCDVAEDKEQYKHESAASLAALKSLAVRQSMPILQLKSFAQAISNVEDYIKQEKKEETFAVLLRKTINERGLVPKEVYEGAGIDRRLFSKINTDDNYHPTKPTAIALGISLQLPESEMHDFLHSAGYSLTNSSVSDLVILFCVQNNIFSLMDVNALLFEVGEKPLGRDLG